MYFSHFERNVAMCKSYIKKIIGQFYELNFAQVRDQSEGFHLSTTRFLNHRHHTTT